MQAIIAWLLANLGPIIGPLILAWIQGLFKKVSPDDGDSRPVEEIDPAEREEKAASVLKAAYAATPRRNIRKRAMLFWMLHTMPAKAKDLASLDRSEKNDLKLYAASADSDS